MKPGKLVGVPDQAAPDGTQAIEVVTDDGERVRVEIPEAQAIELVQRVQSIFLSRQLQGAVHPNYAYLDVQNVYLGHGPGGRVGLMVDTAQTAALALIMSPDMAEHTRKEVDRLVDYLSKRAAPN